MDPPDALQRCIFLARQNLMSIIIMQKHAMAAMFIKPTQYSQSFFMTTIGKLSDGRNSLPAISLFTKTSSLPLSHKLEVLPQHNCHVLMQNQKTRVVMLGACPSSTFWKVINHFSTPQVQKQFMERGQFSIPIQFQSPHFFTK